MLLSELDVDMLRISGWCQYAAERDFATLCSETELQNLLGTGFIKRHRKSGTIVLTGRGAEFLRDIYGKSIYSTPSSYREGIIQRRVRVASTLITAYRAGMDVFAESADELRGGFAMFLPSVTRGRGQNPWGNARLAALVRLGSLVGAVHYVEHGIGRLLLDDELAAFRSSVGFMRKPGMCLIFAGSSYGDILSELEASWGESSGRLVSYGEAYRRLNMPVYLIPCEAAGAVQLRLLAQPDYRRRLAMAALKGRYAPPPEDSPEWDAMFDGLPFVAAADMDLRRIDAAVSRALIQGYGMVALAALEEQARSVLFARYRDKGLARVFTLTESALSELGCGSTPARLRAERPFFTSKGDVANAPLIRVHRKA